MQSNEVILPDMQGQWAQRNVRLSLPQSKQFSLPMMLEFWQVEYLPPCEATYNNLEVDMKGGAGFQYPQPSLDIRLGLSVEGLKIGKRPGS
jgi:hypothetical protein